MTMAVLATQGCGSFNPIAQANTVEQKAYASYGSLVIVEEKVANFTAPTNADVGRDVKLRVAEIAQSTQPLADTLVDGFAVYEVERAKFVADKTREPAFMVAVRNLDRWSSSLTEFVGRLLSAMGRR